MLSPSSLGSLSQAGHNDAQSNSEDEEDEEEAGEEQTPGPVRRRHKRHTRSRKGCVQCKRLKKKCDEARPKCQRCSNTGKPCSYPVVPTTSYVGDVSMHPSSSYSSLSQVLDSAITASPQTTASHPLSPGFSQLLAAITAESTDVTTNNAEVGPSSAANQSQYLPDNPNDLPSLSFMPSPVGQSVSNWGSAIIPSNSMMAQQESTTGVDSIGTSYSEVLNVITPIWSATFPPESSWQTPSLISVPNDCDQTLWNAFVESPFWEGKASNSTDKTLMKYFVDFASVTLVVGNSDNSPSRTFYPTLAKIATQPGQSALMHVLLYVGATHLKNFAVKCGDEARRSAFEKECQKHRAAVMSGLRMSAARDQLGASSEVLPAVMLMLTLASLLSGERYVIASLLDKCKQFLEDLESTTESIMVAQSAAIYGLYKSFHAIGLGKQVDSKTIFISRCDTDPAWAKVAEETVEGIAGISRKMLNFFLQAHSRVVEYDTITAAGKRSPGDGELQFMELDVKMSCQEMLANLDNEERWWQSWIRGYEGRVCHGHSFYRLAIKVMILMEVFGTPGTSTAITTCVEDMLPLFDQITPGSEIGLVWPWMIVACQSPVEYMPTFTAFIERCNWKGSAAPQIAQEVVNKCWAVRGTPKAIPSGTWRQVMRSISSPLII